MTNAKPSTSGVLFVSLTSSPVPFLGGTLVTFPIALVLGIATDGAGAFTLPFVWPAGIPESTAVYFQCAVQDSGAIHGVSLSNGMKATAAGDSVTYVLVEDDFENGLTWTKSPTSPPPGYPSWGILAPFQCLNQQNTSVAGYTKPSTCSWTGLLYSESLISLTVDPPALPAWATTVAIDVSLDARKKSTGNMQVSLWIEDGVGANGIKIFTDTTGNLVHYDLPVASAMGYVQPGFVLSFRFQVAGFGSGVQNEFDIDNFRAELTYSHTKSASCASLALQIVPAESDLTPGGYCTLRTPSVSPRPRMLLVTAQAHESTAGAPVAPASDVLGPAFSPACPALDPNAPATRALVVPANEEFVTIPVAALPLPLCESSFVQYAQVVDTAESTQSDVIQIPILPRN